MKKEGLILLALVLVFGFVVLGCGSTSEIPIPIPMEEIRALKFTLTGENGGIDLLDSVFEFEEGDIIVAVGLVTSWTHSGNEYAPELAFNNRPGNWDTPVGSVDFRTDFIHPDGLFFFAGEIEAASMPHASGSPKGIGVQPGNVIAGFSCLFWELMIIRDDVIFSLSDEIENAPLGDFSIASIDGLAAGSGGANSVFEIVDFAVTEAKAEAYAAALEEAMEDLF